MFILMTSLYIYNDLARDLPTCQQLGVKLQLIKTTKIVKECYNFQIIKAATSLGLRIGQLR